jgi:hypothetical protein
MATNAEWVIPAGIDERRFAVFEVAETYKQSKEYFRPLYAEMDAGGIAAMMFDLLAYDLEGWHPRDDVPRTNALHDQQMQSLSPEDQWWLALLHSGELPELFTNARDITPGNMRRVTAEALFRHARETVPALRSRSDHILARILKKHGANRNGDWRISGKRAWELPPLFEARAAWSARIPTTWETSIDPLTGIGMTDWTNPVF